METHTPMSSYLQVGCQIDDVSCFPWWWRISNLKAPQSTTVPMAQFGVTTEQPDTACFGKALVRLPPMRRAISEGIPLEEGTAADSSEADPEASQMEFSCAIGTPEMWLS